MPEKILFFSLLVISMKILKPTSKWIFIQRAICKFEISCENQFILILFLIIAGAVAFIKI